MSTKEANIFYQPEVYGLTGGMGSGKSTAASRFKENGAYVVDADQVVRDLQVPGSSMLEVMVKVLGDDIIVNGELDRKIVAKRIFNDEELNSRLRAAIHPGIDAEVESRIREAKEDDIVIYDVPILNRNISIGARALAGVIVVDTPIELALKRLKEGRGIDEDEARRRLAHQMRREERLSMANYVIKNDSTTEYLYSQVDEVWRIIGDKRRSS